MYCKYFWWVWKSNSFWRLNVKGKSEIIADQILYEDSFNVIAIVRSGLSI